MFWRGRRAYLTDTRLVSLSRRPPALRLSPLYLTTYNSIMQTNEKLGINESHRCSNLKLELPW